MKIKLLFFAHLREIMGTGTMEVDLKQGSKGEDVIALIEEMKPEIGDHKSYLKLSMNGEYINRTTEIVENTEVAVFPPVSGG